MRVLEAVHEAQRLLSGEQLRALADAVEPHDAAPCATGPVLDGVTVGAQQAVGKLWSAWMDMPELTGAGLALALRTAAAGAEHARARRPRPVWTGPGAHGSQRLTAGVLHELLMGAQERILLISFATHTLRMLAGDLRAAVERGVDVTVLFETTADSAGYYKTADDQPFGSIDGICRLRWPTDRRRPGALLHAKALVIDRRRVLVGSANLTRRALEDNLELGLLIEDPTTARAIEQHVDRLVKERIVVTDE